MTFKRGLAHGLAAVAFACAAGGVAYAQDATKPVAAPGVDKQCELHVWPAERFNAMTTGLLGGGFLDAAIHADKDKSNRTQMASALDPQGQLDALNSLKLADLLKAPVGAVILHPDALDRKTVNKIDTRRAESSSPCYAELIVADVFYHKAAIYGRSLRTLFIYREFGTTEKKPVIYKAWGGNGLSVFPAKEGEDVQAANDELVTVFKANFEEFARNAARRTIAAK